MVIESPFSVPAGPGDEIRGDLRYPAEGRALPLLLICHGFTAHKDWGPFPWFGRRFAELGFATAVFNFSRNGVGPGSRRFNQLEKFSRNTIGREIEDVSALLRAAERGTLGAGIVDASRIGIVGHSRGGGVAILSAALEERLRAVAAWATVSTMRRYTPRQREEWARRGYLPVKVRGYETRLRLSLEVLRDLEENAERYDIVRAVRSLRVPLLLVHGEEDLSVKPDEARTLFAAANPATSQIVLLEGVGHTFGAGHPFRGPHPTVEDVLSRTASWFQKHM